MSNRTMSRQLSSPETETIESPTQLSERLKRIYASVRGLTGVLIRNRPFVCPFEELLLWVPTESTLLDIGCGTGVFAMLAAETRKLNRVVGVDVSNRSIEIAQRAVPEVSLEVEFRAVSAKDSNFTVFENDVVSCIDVLHHVGADGQRQFVSQIASAVRSGGRLVMKDLSPDPPWKAFANRAHDLLLSRQFVQYRNPEEIAAWLEADGLTVKTASRMDRLWYAHFMIVAERRA